MTVKVHGMSPVATAPSENSGGRLSLTSLQQKLRVLADAAKYDASCASSGSYRKRDSQGMGNVEGMGICHSYTPDGRCVSLLKILLTNHCIFDCKFCINRVTSDTPRARFQPAEVVWLTLEFYRRNYIEGLFLSSGIIDSADYTMEQLIEVARSLRKDHRFGGYIHLKVVPGASQELIDKAGLWADRVSVNIELPTQSDLDVLAPAKKIETTHVSMDQIHQRVLQSKDEKKKLKFTPSFAPAGQTTQMIVGATATHDSTILNTSQGLYNTFKLRRVYYSAYSPIPNADALLPVKSPVLVRENRLYQADWLLRFYGFSAEELTTAEAPDLSLEFDPKTAWALRNRGFFPVDINTANRASLLRVPGIGVRNVERILQVRPYRKIGLLDLQKMRISIQKTKFFVVTSDHNPDAFLIDKAFLPKKLKIEVQQLSFFEDLDTKRTGEL